MHSTTRHTFQPELRKGNTGMALTTLLICIVNRVSGKMHPCGTPFSCNFSETVSAILSDFKCYTFIALLENGGGVPLRHERVLYFQVV